MLHITGYQFVALFELSSLQERLQKICHSLDIKGTILLSREGINVNVSGLRNSISTLKHFFQQDKQLKDLTFRESETPIHAFKRLKIKIKNEIITFRQPHIDPTQTKAPYIKPKELKQWLDEKRDVILLDARNDFEIRFGTFEAAIHLHIQHFGEFPSAIKHLPSHQTIVTFCTGGIRCEKAALHLIQQGFKEVYQLEGGIINYFEKVGRAHYQGECFVFDERISLDTTRETAESHPEYN